MKHALKRAAKSGAFLCLFALILLYPQASLSYAATGLKLWFERMVPALFPFMILSDIMVRQNLTAGFAGIIYPVFGPLYQVNRNCVYCILLGFYAAFPWGARTVAELYTRHRLTKREASFLLAFCNNIGPVYYISFLLPVTGLSLKGRLPFYLFGMYGLPLLYGLFLRYTGFLLPKGRFSKEKEAACAETEPSENILTSLDGAIQTSIAGITTLGGYMMFFNLFNLIPPAVLLFFHLPLSQTLLSVCNCLFEITSGISRVGTSSPFTVLLLLPLGGFSCIAQTASMIKDTDLSLFQYLLHKGIQTGLTAGYYLLFRDFLL